MKPILDVCCGSRMFWFNPKNPNAVFLDKRKETDTLCDGRTLRIEPDIIGDFTKLPFEDETFWLVVFDPPHFQNLGEKSWLAKKYGRLFGEWRDDIAEGFSECFRVLKTNGTLIFKWNVAEIPLEEILKLTPREPLFGHTTGRQEKTKWLAFMKLNQP